MVMGVVEGPLVQGAEANQANSDLIMDDNDDDDTTIDYPVTFSSNGASDSEMNWTDAASEVGLTELFLGYILIWQARDLNALDLW